MPGDLHAPLVAEDPLNLDRSTRAKYEEFGWWWACDYPERLPGEGAVFHLPRTKCRACAIALEAVAFHDAGLRLHENDAESGGNGRPLSAAEALEGWKELHGDSPVTGQ